MKTLRIDDLKDQDLESILNQTIKDNDALVIERSDAPHAVIMSLSHYEGLIETIYLLQSPKNAEHLFQSIKQLRGLR